MIIAELIALVAMLGAGAAAVSAVVAWARGSAKKDAEERRKDEQMQKDLRDALKSRDYRQLDDWLVLYGARVDDKVKQHVQVRRDELFIEKNP